LIAKLEPLQSQDLAINLEPSIPQNPNPPREKESQPFEISCEDDLFDANFGNSLNFSFARDLRVIIIQILSRRDLLESVLISI
jgi:hypothetical protein